MEIVEETKLPKVYRSDEYKANNRKISLRRYYEKKGLSREEIPEYKSRITKQNELTEEERKEKAQKAYDLNKKRALERYYRIKETLGIPKKEEKVLTEEEKKTKEYFHNYYIEHKNKYQKKNKRIIDEIKI